MSLAADDKLAIHELLSRAAFALDERLADMLSACFATDAEFTLRISDGDLVGPFVGRDGIMVLMSDAFATQTDQRRHVASNIFFEQAHVEPVSVISNLTLVGTEQGTIRLISAGVYRDQVVKRDGQWQLYRRHLDLDCPY